MMKTKWTVLVVLGVSTVALAGNRPGFAAGRGSQGPYAGHHGYGRQHHQTVPPRYEYHEREVVIPAEYRTVSRREWVEPVYETRVRRVWVETRSCGRPLGLRIGRIKIGLGRPSRNNGYFKTVRERVCVQEGYYRTVQERVCVSPRRVEIVRDNAFVSDGYWTGGRGSSRGPRCGTGISVHGVRYP